VAQHEKQVGFRVGQSESIRKWPGSDEAGVEAPDKERGQPLPSRSGSPQHALSRRSPRAHDEDQSGGDRRYADLAPDFMQGETQSVGFAAAWAF
jgi:hypothetical protein